MLKLRDVTALPGYRLHVEYSDGVTGEVDLSHLVGQGVFAAWNDPSRFQAVTISDHGSLCWGGELDLCPDAIYMEITGGSAEDVFLKKAASADA